MAKSTEKRKDVDAHLPTLKDAEQTRSLEVDPEDCNQSRKIGMFLRSSDFDHIDQINPFLQGESNPCHGKR